jgi:predicted RNase H-like HicB family nuclease
MKLKVVIHAAEPPQRRCRAEVPVLPGCVSEGDTPEEALANIRSVIASYFDTTAPQRGDADRVEEIELSLRQDEPSHTSVEQEDYDGIIESSMSAIRRFPMEHGRHETAALVALTAGLFSALVCGALALAPLWIGFLIGYLTMASFAALVCTVNP